MTPAEVARQEEIRKGIAAGNIGTGGSPAQTLPETRDRTSGQLAGTISPTEQATIDALGGGADAIKAVREARQQQIIKESGSRAATDKITASLKDQGITEDAIVEATKGAKTQFEKFQAINRLQKKETLKRIRTEKDKRVASRISKRAKRNEDGTARNDPAVAEDYDSFFTEINPATGKPNQDLMTPSQKREYNRYMEKVSRGNVSDSEAGRIENIKKRVSGKIKVAESARLVEVRRKEMQEDIDNAQSKAEKDFYSNLKSQIDGIQARIDEGSYTPAQKKAGLEKQHEIQMRELMNKRAAGYNPPQAEPETKTVTTQAQYDALSPGTQYLNKNGQTATKPE
jgi:hypothetical protein